MKRLSKTPSTARREPPQSGSRTSQAEVRAESGRPGWTRWAARADWADWKMALGVFLAALLVRVLYLLEFRRSPFFPVLLGDSQSYDQWAQRLAAGDWIGKVVFYQSPLYPYLLGVLYEIVGRDLVVARLLQGLAGAAGCALIAFAATRVFGARAGLVSGLLLAVYAPAIFYDSLIQKTSLDFLLSSALVCLIAVPVETFSNRRYWSIGLVTGALCLNRENAMFLVPLVLLWAWRREPSRRQPVLWLLFGFGLVIAPVTARNWAVGRELVVTTSQFGPNLYIGNNPEANGYYQPLLPGRGSPEFEQRDAIALAEKDAGRALNHTEVSHYWQRRAWNWMKENPGRWLELTGRRFLLFWNALEVMDTEDLGTHAGHSAVLRGTRFAFHFGLLAPLALVGLWAFRSRWREFGIFLGILGVYTLSVALFFVIGRYRYPLVPILALFAGAGAVHLATLVKSGNWRGLGPAAALLGILVVAMNLPLGSPAEMGALTRANYARAFAETGNREAAIGLYREALALTPGAPRVASALGAELAQVGRFAEAKPYLEQALLAEPDLAAAHNSLGSVHAAAGEQERAIAEFAAAAEAEPESAVFAFNLGTALSIAGRLDESIRQFSRAAALDPENAAIRNNLGIALARAGRIEESVAQLETAARLQPANPDTARNLSRARDMLQSFREAPRGEVGDPRAAGPSRSGRVGPGFW